MRNLLLLSLALFLPFLFLENSEEAQDGVDALLKTVDLSEWDDLFRELDVDGTEKPSDYLHEIAQMRGQPFSTSVGKLQEQLLPSVRPAVIRTVLLLGIAIFGAALNGLSDDSAIGENARTAFRITASGIVLVMAFMEIRTALHMLTTIDRVTEILLPAITGFLMLSGMTNTAALLPASYMLLSELVMKTITSCIAPLAVTGGVMLVLDAGSTGKLASAGRVLHRAAKWILATACSLYMVITTIRSAASASADGLLIRTTKIAAGSIPAIGSLLTESVDVAFQCLHFVRSALGLTGCLVLLLAVLKPLLSTIMTCCSFRTSAMLAEPLSGKQYADLLRGMGDTLHILMLCGSSATAMALLMIAPVFGSVGGV